MFTKQQCTQPTPGLSVTRNVHHTLCLNKLNIPYKDL